MKKIFAAIAVIMLTGFAATAQDKQKDSLRKGKGQRMEHMKDLNLSDDQKTKLEALRIENKQKMEALKNTTGDKEELHKQRQELAKAHQESVKAILTPEQQKLMKEKRKTMMAERKGQGRDGRKMHKGNKVKDGKSKEGKMHKGMKKDRMESLNLSTAQKEDMKKLRIESKDKMEAIKNNKSLNENDRKAQLDSLKKEQREKMMRILTPEQKAKMKENPRRIQKK